MKYLNSTWMKIALACAAGFALVSTTVIAQDTNIPCVRTKFETKLTQDACGKAGQEEAKKAWKAWTAEAKKADASLSCKSCHSKLGPDYPLTADGLQQFKKLGGK